jgi:hypothetical protein
LARNDENGGPSRPVSPAWRAVAAALVAAWATSASAAIPGDRLDLGAVPTSGAEAASTLGVRRDAVVTALACGREFELWDRVPFEDAPANDSKEERERFTRDVYPELIGKAAFLARFPGVSCRYDVPYGERNPAQVDEPFSEPFLACGSPAAPTSCRWAEPQDVSAKAALLNALDARFQQKYGTECAAAFIDVLPAAGSGNATLSIALSPDCLRAQVNRILAKRDRFDSNPGSAGLPCHVVGAPPHGDWDMSVYQLTRLVFLARADRALFTEDTRAKLDQLLTLSGPLQGESYGLYQCGNPDNTTGSAEERAAEADFYDDGFFDHVGDLVEWLLAFLSVVLIFVAAAVVAAAALGAALGPAGLAGAALAGAAIGANVALPITLIRIEETENHLLMINTSKYLKNQLIIEELTDEDDRQTFRGYNKDLRNWLLERMKTIVEDDFVEYNSRPYARLSLGAILNLHDFADRQDLKKAAAAVLDLAAVKTAIGSSQARRIVPFRRLAGSNAVFAYGDNLASPDPRSLFAHTGLADHQIAAMLFWSGQSQHTAGGRVGLGTASEMIFEATSTYAPDRLILDIAIDKSRPYEQRFRHGGWEHYSSGPGWLLTAGGTSTTFAQKGLISPFSIPFVPPLGPELGLLKNENRGTGVPTTLIPLTGATRQHRYVDFLRFEGFVRNWPKAEEGDAQPISFDGNLCLDRGFACGLRLVMPPAIQSCLQRPPGTPENLSFIDSAACVPYQGASRFFVVVYRQRCSLGFELCKGGHWGFIEVVDAAPNQSLVAFAASTIARNGGRFASMRAAAGADGINEVSYVSWNSGTILFDVDAADDDADATGIISIDGAPTIHADLDDWGRADGDLVTYEADARVTISRPPNSRRILIDLTDAKDPKREIAP